MFSLCFSLECFLLCYCYEESRSISCVIHETFRLREHRRKGQVNKFLTPANPFLTQTVVFRTQRLTRPAWTYPFFKAYFHLQINSLIVSGSTVTIFNF